MHRIQTYTVELAGSSYEIGRQLAARIADNPPLRSRLTAGLEGFDAARADEAARLFKRWCPGLNEELAGLAAGLDIPPERVYFSALTYLVPRCSQIALLPGCTAGGRPLLARSYEFSHEAEDFCLVRTAVRGRHVHLGTSVLQLGREDGVNDCGLAVTMSSFGFPVGALPFMRAPKLTGLQYWAVIRALLENCADVDEALAYLEGMPVAYNINLLLLDKSGHGALVETLDGRSAVKRIGPDSPEQMLWAANHAVLSPLREAEPRVMAHSARRYTYLREQLSGRSDITREMLKELLLSPYPDGLCCHYYEEFFGTTKSMVLSPAEGTVELCWGGRAENGWRTYDVARPLETGVLDAAIHLEHAAPGTYDWIPAAR